jgi:galactokinase/galacturonokinase
MRRTYGVPPADVRVVVSPYRICPLGAHVDHQRGVVTGMALDQAVLLAFAPAPEASAGRVSARTHSFDHEVSFELDAIPPVQRGDWGNYLRGAALSLRQEYGERLRRGMLAIVDGRMPIGGLSSSAAVGVAYLLALEAVNGLDVNIAENIRLDRAIENGYIGLNNGILDQSVILASRRDQLLRLDCASQHWQAVAGPQRDAFDVLVFHSGVTAALVTTGYNQRVAECRDAARRLLVAAGRPASDDAVLRDVPEEVFLQSGDALPEPIRRRATHYFTEQARVRDGVDAWRAADLARFGSLVTQSGRSSMENYECGSPQLIAIYELLAGTPGVFGARFSGAGFRGSCVALVDPVRAEDIAATAAEGYARRHPADAEHSAIVVCDTDDGARLL